jgi:hypothetical protein
VTEFVTTNPKSVSCREACKLGYEGIAASGLARPAVREGFAHWVKVKNPNAPAVRREAEED